MITQDELIKELSKLLEQYEHYLTPEQVEQIKSKITEERNKLLNK